MSAEWRTLGRPGYFGKQREPLRSFWNEQYGPEGENWRIGYIWGDSIIPRDVALQIYEDGYYEFFRTNPDKLNWLITTASDVYDTAETNVLARLSYDQQETPNNHIHDVSIRRAVLRLGSSFQGDRLVHVRWTDSEGYEINPGVVPFHLPKMIAQPKVEGWWFPDTIEDFYQCNKVIEVNPDLVAATELSMPGN